jgi:hypothetical protein
MRDERIVSFAPWLYPGGDLAIACRPARQIASFRDRLPNVSPYVVRRGGPRCIALGKRRERLGPLKPESFRDVQTFSNLPDVLSTDDRARRQLGDAHGAYAHSGHAPLAPERLYAPTGHDRTQADVPRALS